MDSRSRFFNCVGPSGSVERAEDLEQLGDHVEYRDGVVLLDAFRSKNGKEFNSKKHGEVDFLIEKGGAVLPLEVKSGSVHKAHAALDNMMAVPDYGLKNAVVYNTQREIEDLKRVVYLPIYVLMFLSHDVLPTNAVYRLDL